MNKRSPALLAAATVATLLPFINRAFDIDEPLFLWMARQICKHPFDPYGLEINWGWVPQPMSVVMQNPPLCSYYIAAVAKTAGWGEVTLHLAFLLPAVAAILGTYFLARRFCQEPMLAAALTLFTPVFLISATSVMCDVTLLAFWVWAMEFWLAGLEQERWGLSLCAALAIVGATLTKYFGISLVPLLLVYTIARQRRVTLTNLWFLLPIGIAIAYECVTRSLYGRPLLTSAVTYLCQVAAAVHPSRVVQFFTGCSFAGGCLVGVIFFIPFQRGSKWLLVFGVMIGAAFALYTNVGSSAGDNRYLVELQTALFIGTGIAILLLATGILRDWRSPNSPLLFFWIGGTFFFATFLNWSITARTFLPMAPAVAIITAQAVERSNLSRKWWRVGVLAALTLLIACSDFQLANASRAAAHHFRQLYGKTDRAIWFQSHWGFQWYMQRWKAKAMEPASRFRPGDIVIIPSHNANPYSLSSPSTPLKNFTVKLPLACATFAPGTGTAFYSNVRGPMPWGFARVPPLQWQALLVTQPRHAEFDAKDRLMAERSVPLAPAGAH